MRKLRSLPVVALALSTALGLLTDLASQGIGATAHGDTDLASDVVIGENHSFDNRFGVDRPHAGRDAQLVGGCSLTQQPRHQLNATQSAT